MSLCGYISSTGSAVVQSQSAINSIINIYMFGPLLIFVGVLIVGLLYQLDKKYPAIMKELAEREARGELATTVIETDDDVPQTLLARLGALDNVISVRFIHGT